MDFVKLWIWLKVQVKLVVYIMNLVEDSSEIGSQIVVNIDIVL